MDDQAIARAWLVLWRGTSAAALFTNGLILRHPWPLWVLGIYVTASRESLVQIPPHLFLWRYERCDDPVHRNIRAHFC